MKRALSLPWLPQSVEDRIAQSPERTRRIVDAHETHGHPDWPTLILEEVTHGNSRYRERNPGFLADWYESVIAGRVDAGLLREFVSIADDDWEQGAEHIRDHLAAFEIGRRLRDATPLAEEIVFDEPTGKLRVEPIPMLPPDLYQTGLEKLQDAVDDARAAITRNPNSYSALLPTLQLLDRTLTKYRGNPQRVHDDQLLAHRKVAQLIDDGYVPADEEITSLLQVLDTNAVDIRAAVPAVAVAVKRRSEVRFHELEPAERDRVRSAVDAVASCSEESLAEEMRGDDRATFETEGAPVDVESPYRLVGRLNAVARTVRSLEQIVGFAERHGPLVASLGNELMQPLAKLVGLWHDRPRWLLTLLYTGSHSPRSRRRAQAGPMSSFGWPATVKPTPEGVEVSLPDWPDIIESGTTVQEAVLRARDALNHAVMLRIRTGTRVPPPGDLQPGQVLVPIAEEVAVSLEAYAEERDDRLFRDVTELQRVERDRRAAFWAERQAYLDLPLRFGERADAGAREFASIGIRFCYLLNAGGLIAVPAIMEILPQANLAPTTLLVPTITFVVGVLLAAATNFLAYHSMVMDTQSHAHHANAAGMEVLGMHFPPRTSQLTMPPLPRPALNTSGAGRRQCSGPTLPGGRSASPSVPSSLAFSQPSGAVRSRYLALGETSDVHFRHPQRADVSNHGTRQASSSAAINSVPLWVRHAARVCGISPWQTRPPEAVGPRPPSACS